jgi:hypothetical protein
MREFVPWIVTVGLVLTGCDSSDSSAISQPEPTASVASSEETATTLPPTVPPTLPPGKLDDVFLRLIRGYSHDLDGVEDNQLVTWGRGVCDGWDRDLTWAAQVAVFTSAGYAGSLARPFIETATETYCPDHKDKYR